MDNSVRFAMPASTSDSETSPVAILDATQSLPPLVEGSGSDDTAVSDNNGDVKKVDADEKAEIQRLQENFEERIRALEEGRSNVRASQTQTTPARGLWSFLRFLVEHEGEGDNIRDGDGDSEDEPEVEGDRAPRPRPRGRAMSTSKHHAIKAALPHRERSMSVSSSSSVQSDASVIYDENHPVARARAHAHHIDDETLKKFAIEREKLEQLSHKERVKYFQERARMEFNQEGMDTIDRERLLLKLGRALVHFGAPNHRVEQILTSVASLYDIPSSVLLFPTMLVFAIRRGELKSDVHYLRVQGSVQLSSLHNLHELYRKISHGDLTAREGCRQIQALLSADYVYGRIPQLMFAFFGSLLVCLVGFEGSFLDSLVSGLFGVILFYARSHMDTSDVYANLYEVIMAFVVSFAARALSTIHSSSAHFCYTSVMSASIVSFLPGFLALSASMELGSKNLICGSVKLVYGLVYVLILGFCLTLGSKLWLGIDTADAAALANASGGDATTDTVYGLFQSDNMTQPINLKGIWTFTTTLGNTTDNTSDQVTGCYRASGDPWYLQPISFGLTLGLVPLFALVVALSSGQACYPLLYRKKDGGHTLHRNVKELFVMVVIAIAGYITNYTANMKWASHSDIVSAYGAFVIGLLGNLYSRLLRGTAFTAMVPGVLLLVPSGLSAVGGVTSENGFDIGTKMLAVVIGITTGLFLSTAIVYLAGNRKKGAIMSF